MCTVEIRIEGNRVKINGQGVFTADSTIDDVALSNDGKLPTVIATGYDLRLYGPVTEVTAINSNVDCIQINKLRAINSTVLGGYGIGR
jgi:hypothetical protein